MTMPFLHPEWRAAFSAAGLNTFADFWALAGQKVDEGNAGRGGFSDVFRCELRGPDGQTREIFVKRQQNYAARSWRHPIRGIPTAQREFEVIQQLLAAGIGAPEPLYFGITRTKAGFQSVLITLGLTGYVTWMEMQDKRRAGVPYAARERWRAIRASGELLGRLHRLGLRHTCFYPKHIFLRDDGQRCNACVIDLEQAKANVFGLGEKKDIISFVNRRGTWSATEQLRFVLAYCGCARPNRDARRVFAFLRAQTMRRRSKPSSDRLDTPVETKSKTSQQPLSDSEKAA